MERQKRILFICAGNFCRSPTAEDLLKQAGGYDVKSAGIFEGSAVEVTQEMLDWADIVFVMEHYMKQALTDHVQFHWEIFGRSFSGFKTEAEKVKVLNIPDKFGYGSPWLVSVLKEKLLEYGIDTRHVKFKARGSTLPSWIQSALGWIEVHVPTRKKEVWEDEEWAEEAWF